MPDESPTTPFAAHFMKTLLLIAAIFLPAHFLTAAESAGPTLAQGQARLLRHPAYYQGQVAFSYLGDIWVARENGSEIRRLTDHRARDVYPRFSPDGKSIAFSSNRDGNYDVFVVPAAGGKPRQLTFHSVDDTVNGWTVDGRRIIFSSSRNLGVFPGVVTLFEVSIDGGMEQPVETDWGSWAGYSPDGSKLAFTRHPSSWTRKHYRGSYATDLWVMETASRKFTKLGDPDYKGNYLWPMFANNGDVYFVADRLPGDAEKKVRFAGPEVMKSINNIWKISERGGKPVQVTQHTSGNLSFPSISADGKTIVYEENFGLWKLDVASGKSSEIRINISSDVKENDVELRTISGEADAFSLSPSTRRAAISTRGEILTIATDRGEVQRVTETFWREHTPSWSPDGKSIAFISDRTGREEIWIADERGQGLKQLSDLDCDKSSITWAPDSKSLLWTGSDHKLRRVRIDDGQTEMLASSEVSNIGTPRFSPDGKWISYSKQDTLLRSHVYVKSLGGGEERRVEAEDFLMSSGARWTPDGKKLLLLGGVGAPGMASLNRTTLQLYSVALTHLEKNPDDRDVDSEEEALKKEDAPRSKRSTNASPSTAKQEGEDSSSKETNAPAKVEVKIEWEGIERRIKKLTTVGGSVTAVAPSPDSRTYAFVASGLEDGDGGSQALYSVAEDGTKLTRLSYTPAAEPSEEPRARGTGRGGLGEPQFSKDGRSIFYIQSNGIYSVGVPASATTDASTGSSRSGSSGSTATSGAAPASSAAAPRRISFTIRLEVDETAQRRQVFEESWRVMKNRFYDPKMHGVDWPAAKLKYEPLLAHITDSDELHTVIMQMIGELNASHTGVSGGGRDAGERVQTRHPGFDLAAHTSGRFQVSYIYKKGPADHDYVRISKGDFILAVNGRPLWTTNNYWKFFNLVPGRKFELTLNSKPALEGSWAVSVEPLSWTAKGNLDYERWVNERKAMVHQLSKGEIGYLHIRAMNEPSFQKFQRDLLDNLGKKALIIDERFNGGGGIDQELLEILNQRIKYQSWRGRDSVEVPRPVQAFFGPMCVLQNERSASNAEMFPDGFRKLGLGKVIGVPTMGAVIGTGAYRLLDGSSIRTPGFGVFTASGESLENYGVQPDIYVDNTPEDFLAGRDRQIEKAIEVLRADMK